MVENKNYAENLLNLLMDDDNLEVVEAALKKRMNAKKLKDFAHEKMGGAPKLDNKKKGDKIQQLYRYSIRIDGKQKSFTGTTEAIVYKKVWDYFHTADATLRDAFKQYYAEREKQTNLSSETIRYDLVTWNRFFEKHPIANRKIKDITAYEISQFYKDITGRGLIAKKAFSKPSGLLLGIYSEAVRTKLCPMNVAREVDTKNLKFKLPTKKTIYTDDEVKILLDYVKSIKQDVFTYAVRLHFCFNMRIGEIRALTWDDYDTENEELNIWHQIVKEKVGNKRSYVDVNYTKSHRESGIRPLPVSPEAKQILSELRILNGNKKYILQGMNGARFPISTERFNDHLKRYCTACGIKYRPSHNARFLGITKMYEAGFDEAVIQRSAGHSTIEMTRHYNRDRRSNKPDREKWNSIYSYT